GVTMTVVDGSAYPGQVKVTILNATDTEIDSGNSADFFLQVEQDGQWYNLIPKQKEYDNTGEGYIYNEDTPGEMTFQWASLYGSLDPGHYRAVKWFSEFHEDETDPDKRNINFALAAEFDIA
ncbi:MAG: immunoglobulin-like domain-containing protein, partial [Dysosmobacter sp.]